MRLRWRRNSAGFNSERTRSPSEMRPQSGSIRRRQQRPTVFGQPVIDVARRRAAPYQIAQQFAVPRVDDNLALLVGAGAGHDHLAQQAAPHLDLAIALIGKLPGDLTGIIGRGMNRRARKKHRQHQQQRGQIQL